MSQNGAGWPSITKTKQPLPDADDWIDRLTIVGIDLRDPTQVIALADEVAARHARAAALAGVIRGIASTDKPMVGHYTDSDEVLDFLQREKLAPLAELGTSCPDHFLRTKVKPLVLDLPATASVEEQTARLRELHEAYRADYAAYYERYAEPDSPAMRGADPLIVLVPGVGMFSYGADKQTARVASP